MPEPPTHTHVHAYSLVESFHHPKCQSDTKVIGSVQVADLREPRANE